MPAERETRALPADASRLNFQRASEKPSSREARASKMGLSRGRAIVVSRGFSIGSDGWREEFYAASSGYAAFCAVFRCEKCFASGVEAFSQVSPRTDGERRAM